MKIIQVTAFSLDSVALKHMERAAHIGKIVIGVADRG